MTNWARFYPRDAMHSAVFVTATCPSVCLSVTRRYCIKTKSASVTISSSSQSRNILVFGNIQFIQKFERSRSSHSRARAIYETGVGTNYEMAILAIFRPIKKPPYFRKVQYRRTKVTIEHYKRISHTRFRWSQNQRPWVTLN